MHKQAQNEKYVPVPGVYFESCRHVYGPHHYVRAVSIQEVLLS